MKKILIFSLLLIALKANAQIIQVQIAELKKNTEIYSISNDCGESVIQDNIGSGGFYQYKNGLLGIRATMRSTYIYYLKKINNKLYAGPCIGHNYDVFTDDAQIHKKSWSRTLPGAMISFRVDHNLSLYSWTGFSEMAERMNLNPNEPRFFGSYESAIYKYHRFDISGSLLIFRGCHPIIDCKYTQPLGSAFSLFANWGYNSYGNGYRSINFGVILKCINHVKTHEEAAADRQKYQDWFLKRKMLKEEKHKKALEQKKQE